MKLELKNPNNIVTNAHFNINEAGNLSVYIDTMEKLVTPDTMGWERDSVSFSFWDENDFHTDNQVGDIVTLISENPDDLEMINRIYFLLSNKDQLWYLFPKEEVWK